MGRRRSGNAVRCGPLGVRLPRLSPGRKSVPSSQPYMRGARHVLFGSAPPFLHSRACCVHKEEHRVTLGGSILAALGLVDVTRLRPRLSVAVPAELLAIILLSCWGLVIARERPSRRNGAVAVSISLKVMGFPVLLRRYKEPK